MHQYRSLRTLRQLKRRAFHYLVNWLLAGCAIVLIVESAYERSYTPLAIGIGFGLIYLASITIFTVKANSLLCPLCRTPFWSKRKCSRNARVKKTLGLSYRLGVALSILFRGRYRCPYCGEPFDATSPRIIRKPVRHH